MLAIALTESNCSYDAKHADSKTCGIGGIKRLFWADVLGDTNANSLKAIELVINHLISKNNGSIYHAIREYKGGIANLKTTNKCYDLYKRLNSESKTRA